MLHDTIIEIFKKNLNFIDFFLKKIAERYFELSTQADQITVRFIEFMKLILNFIKELLQNKKASQ